MDFLIDTDHVDDDDDVVHDGILGGRCPGLDGSTEEILVPTRAWGPYISELKDVYIMYIHFWKSIPFCFGRNEWYFKLATKMMKMNQKSST